MPSITNDVKPLPTGDPTFNPTGMSTPSPTYLASSPTLHPTDNPIATLRLSIEPSSYPSDESSGNNNKNSGSSLFIYVIFGVVGLIFTVCLSIGCVYYIKTKKEKSVNIKHVETEMANAITNTLDAGGNTNSNNNKDNNNNNNSEFEVFRLDQDNVIFEDDKNLDTNMVGGGLTMAIVTPTHGSVQTMAKNEEIDAQLTPIMGAVKG